MKLPVRLNIKGDTIWTAYRDERDAAKVSVEELRAFVERWGDVYPFMVGQVIITQELLDLVRSEVLGEEDSIALNIILPSGIFRAMLRAKEFGVSLNLAFIQANGGLEAFEYE